MERFSKARSKATKLVLLQISRFCAEIRKLQRAMDKAIISTRKKCITTGPSQSLNLTVFIWMGFYESAIISCIDLLFKLFVFEITKLQSFYTMYQAFSIAHRSGAFW